MNLINTMILTSTPAPGVVPPRAVWTSSLSDLRAHLATFAPRVLS
jgi:hypothetical protein